jgi:hypothetical protein
MTTVIECHPPAGGRNALVTCLGTLRRIFGAFIAAMDESRRKQAEREFAYFVVRQGGRITDELEREMMRRRSTSDWSLRA